MNNKKLLYFYFILILPFQLFSVSTEWNGARSITTFEQGVVSGVSGILSGLSNSGAMTTIQKEISLSY